MSAEECQLLSVLDSILNQDVIRARIDAIAKQVEQELAQTPAALMAWQPIPLLLYDRVFPAGIASSWVFILRGGATTGAERHPNSHQRVMSFRGQGDLQTMVSGEWRSNELVSDPDSPLLRRWESIPPNVWHQAVVPHHNWVVISFHTATAHALIEERLDGDVVRRRLYLAE
jgi:hypothetical protein